MSFKKQMGEMGHPGGGCDTYAARPWEMTYVETWVGIISFEKKNVRNDTRGGVCLHTGVHTHRGRIYCRRNTLKGGCWRQPDITLAERPHAPAVPILRGNTREKALGEKIIEKTLTLAPSGTICLSWQLLLHCLFSIVLLYAAFGPRRETSPSAFVHQELHPRTVRITQST